MQISEKALKGRNKKVGTQNFVPLLVKNYIHKNAFINIIKYQIINAKAERFNGTIQKLNYIPQEYRNFDNLRIGIFFL